MAETNNDTYEDLKKVFENLNTTIDGDHGTWLKLVRDKLYSMFCSPMKEEYIHEAFKWVSHLCISLGDFSWISSNEKWTRDEVKIFSCIARLSITEVYILLPMIQRHLTCGEEPEIEDGKLLARSANPEDYDRLGDHLVILENVIKSLVEGQELDDGEYKNEKINPLTASIEAEELINLLDSLKKAMTLICEYLELVHRYWQELINQTNSEKFSSAEGALRIICVWLSEDPGGFESQCKRFLIDLIIKNLLLIHRPSRNDLLILSLHSICTHNDNMSEELRKTSRYEEALEKYLDYVQRAKNISSNGSNERQTQKLYKLRCGLIKDLLLKTKGYNDQNQCKKRF